MKLKLLADEAYCALLSLRERRCASEATDSIARLRSEHEERCRVIDKRPLRRKVRVDDVVGVGDELDKVSLVSLLGLPLIDGRVWGSMIEGITRGSDEGVTGESETAW